MTNQKRPLLYILEESPVYREIIPKCLDVTLPGCQIFTFKHPRDLVMALSGKPDLLVSEYSFSAPGFDGGMILKQVKEKSPQTKVIFLTEHHNIVDAVKSIRSGATDYIPKSKTAFDSLIQKMLLIKENLEYLRKSDRILLLVSILLIAAITVMAGLVVWYQWVL